MPYDMPLSLDEALMDPELRRRAAAYLGGGGDEVPAPPVDPGSGNQVPEGTTGTAPPAEDDFIRRYLEAQGADTRQERLNSVANGFNNAAETVLGGVGVRYARSAPQAPHAADDVLAAERVKTDAERAAKPAAPGKTPSDPNSPEVKSLQAFARARWPQEPDAVIKAIVPERFESIRKTLDAKYGIKSREGIAADTAARDKAKTKQGDVHFWAKMQQDAEQFDVSDATRRYIAEQALKAAEAARDEAAAAKAKDKADALNVPGFDVADGATPTLDDAKKLKDTNESALRMRGTIKNLRTLHQKYGESPKGAGADLQQQALRAVQLEAKNIVGLGALSGPDFGLMQDLSAQDANSITEWVRRKFTGATLEESLQGLERWMDTVVAATAESRGYRLKPQGAPVKGGPTRNSRPAFDEASLGPKDAAALKWARADANKNDPRAAAILKRLGAPR